MIASDEAAAQTVSECIAGLLEVLGRLHRNERPGMRGETLLACKLEVLTVAKRLGDLIAYDRSVVRSGALMDRTIGGAPRR